MALEANWRSGKRGAGESGRDTDGGCALLPETCRPRPLSLSFSCCTVSEDRSWGPSWEESQVLAANGGRNTAWG